MSSVRVDEFAPVSTVNADGGGTVAFECTSPANSFWCPRLSYFNFRLKVTSRKADGTAEALTSTDATASNLVTTGTVQFRSYPAAACVQSFSHSINGVTVETVSDVQETAAFLNRTGMSYEYARTAGNSLYRLAGADGKRNSESVAPGGALQPWNTSGNTKTVFDCGFLPPSGVFSMPGTIPGGRHRFVLTLNNDLRKTLHDHGLDAIGAYIVDYKLYLLHDRGGSIPHVPPCAGRTGPRPAQCRALDPPAHGRQKSAVGFERFEHAHAQRPSVDRQTFRRRESYDCRQHPRCARQPRPVRAVALSSTGSVCGPDATKHRVPEINKSATDRHVVKPYADFLAACGKLYLEQSSYGNMEEWSNNPIQGLSFEKSPNDSSTSVIVRCTRSATANDLVNETAASAAAAANIVVCAQSHQAIVLTYGDDGLVSSCDSVVEL